MISTYTVTDSYYGCLKEILIFMKEIINSTSNSNFAVTPAALKGNSPVNKKISDLNLECIPCCVLSVLQH